MAVVLPWGTPGPELFSGRSAGKPIASCEWSYPNSMEPSRRSALEIFPLGYIIPVWHERRRLPTPSTRSPNRDGDRSSTYSRGARGR